ncbi:MAG TPA: tRNA (adenosine(37)-N6)-threonylcarbamoyltransferase complex transferase subunit TsaD [Opitutales bacterium]|nr:tRNA (adenosine(37)-N6)-threonylcarbamoyltransferase complex transferase subunit TsaD [Opitutales bacterium]
MILGIESSCDESALAVFSPDRGIVGEWVSSQIDLHRIYGGVVPDLASREHLENFPALCEVLKAEIGWGKIAEIAVTNGPGLAGCLALGISLAKSISVARDLPLRGINHLRAHAFSPFIDLHREEPKHFRENLRKLTPHLGLLVSGGNTLLLELDESGRLETVAETVDDAAGEALDKGAKLLGLGYPGGPIVEKLARDGDPKLFDFPRAFRSRAERKFSFSGLKTSLRYRLEKISDRELEKVLPDLCAGYQQAVVDALVGKSKQILASGRYKSFGLSGGVANNRLLRSACAEMTERARIPLFRARPEHTGDNAAMVAFAAWADPQIGQAEEGLDVTLHPARQLAVV